MLQYNKLYQSLKKVSAEWHAGHVQWDFCWDYLKFYKDGIVINAYTPTDKVSEINVWLDIKNTKGEFPIGKFTILENKISIELESSNSTVKIDGVIINDTLILRKTNSFNHTENWDYYGLVD